MWSLMLRYKRCVGSISYDPYNNVFAGIADINGTYIHFESTTEEGIEPAFRATVLRNL